MSKNISRFVNIKTIVVAFLVIALVVSGFLIYKKVSNESVVCYVTNKNAISVYERWTICFQKELNNDDLSKIKISVTKKSTNSAQKIQRNTTEDMKSIEIVPPDKGYEAGTVYTLKIESDIPYTFNGKTTKSTEFDFTPEKAYKNVKLTFKDKNLEKVIRERINKPSGDIYIYDVEDIDCLVANNRGIKDLSGIEGLVNLRDLYLDVNNIEDIAPLKGLVYLQKLGLSNNKIKDIKALKGMKLNNLALSGNDIKSYKPVEDIYNTLEWKDFYIK